ncbi:MAG: SpoIIE family protein phosphatase, partial [Phycisphaerae bacterium]|nr:SpoIIE family protein phosphatase [Phycisphaerae bacterium]NIR62228.1 SpoIIE family protein phosphatase [candidate division Zixibacteria bacterium]NIW43225.1 SpoIIE family protein phosphatase [Gammaproteobacteria bacterium]NIP50541.1 SpoIIE family protein phosphatase [Phycisphaerae bacterium]NIU12474.1 SpoIIE family protein phosphatase [candidate division Zixibacteria bacterium]
MSALDLDVRSASITAKVDTTLFQLEQQSLYDSMSDQIEVAREIIHVLCQRLRGNMQDWAEDFQHRKALERELEIGREIQNSFLPDELPQLPGWEIAAYFQAAREVAGDFYDAFTLPREKKIGLVIGDVADKGVGAALFMTLFRSLIRATATSDYFLDHARSHAVSDTIVGHQETT